MKFKDIPQFTRCGSYQVNVNWKYMKDWVESNQTELGLQMNPLFQRGHVWSKEQQIAYVEFILRGGKSSRDVYFNCPGWHWQVKEGEYNDFVCVDGLQRITAVLAFMDNEIPAFGAYLNKFEDRVPMDADLVIHVNDLKTEKEVLQWYIDLNTGGTPHTKREIQRVKDMIAAYDNGTPVEQNVTADLDVGMMVTYKPNGEEITRGVVVNIHRSVIGIENFDVRLADGSIMLFRGLAIGKSVFVCNNSDEEGISDE